MKKILRRKQLFSWIYLLLGIALFVLTFIPSFRVNFLAAVASNGPEYFFILWMCGALCLAHWFYGVFYYPAKYCRHLAMEVDFAYPEQSKCDLSDARGYLVSLILWVVCVILAVNKADKLEVILLFFISLLTFGLSFITRTNNLFAPGEVTFDEGAFLGQEAGKKTKCLYFLYPNGENERLWGNKVAAKYIKDELQKLKQSVKKNKEAAKEIQARTEEIYELCN